MILLRIRNGAGARLSQVSERSMTLNFSSARKSLLSRILNRVPSWDSNPRACFLPQMAEKAPYYSSRTRRFRPGRQSDNCMRTIYGAYTTSLCVIPHSHDILIFLRMLEYCFLRIDVLYTWYGNPVKNEKRKTA